MHILANDYYKLSVCPAMLVCFVTQIVLTRLDRQSSVVCLLSRSCASLPLLLHSHQVFLSKWLTGPNSVTSFSLNPVPYSLSSVILLSLCILSLPSLSVPPPQGAQVSSPLVWGAVGYVTCFPSCVGCSGLRDILPLLCGVQWAM